MNDEIALEILEQLKETHKTIEQSMTDLNREMREIKVRITEMNQ
jgi:hypothetical protein